MNENRIYRGYGSNPSKAQIEETESKDWEGLYESSKQAHTIAEEKKAKQWDKAQVKTPFGWIVLNETYSKEVKKVRYDATVEGALKEALCDLFA